MYTLRMWCVLYRIDAVVDPWLEQLWEVLMKLHPLPPNMTVIDELQLYPKMLTTKNLLTKRAELDIL